MPLDCDFILRLEWDERKGEGEVERLSCDQKEWFSADLFNSRFDAMEERKKKRGEKGSVSYFQDLEKRWCWRTHHHPGLGHRGKGGGGKSRLRSRPERDSLSLRREAERREAAPWRKKKRGQFKTGHRVTDDEPVGGEGGKMATKRSRDVLSKDGERKGKERGGSVPCRSSVPFRTLKASSG